MSPCLLAGPANAGTTLFRIVFASVKGEMIDLQAWTTKAAARRPIVEYIAWYNGTRLHRTLGYRNPAESEEDNKIKKVA
jgi:transposase InsO family protein